MKKIIWMIALFATLAIVLVSCASTNKHSNLNNGCWHGMEPKNRTSKMRG